MTQHFCYEIYCRPIYCMILEIVNLLVSCNSWERAIKVNIEMFLQKPLKYTIKIQLKLKM